MLDSDPALSRFTIGRSALLVGLCYLTCALLGILLSRGVYKRSFSATATSKGDNQEYLQLTRSMLDNRLDDPALARSKRLYLGMPMAAALVSRITRLDPVYALPLTCWIAAALSWYLGCRLYGPPTGALILCIDFSLMERFLYGGPEAPVLFLCLLGLWFGRKRSMAAICAASASLALAVTFRPFAGFFLIALWLVLLARRAFAALAPSAAITAAVLASYLLFIHSARMASDPVTGYAGDWYGTSPVSWPLWPLIFTILHRGEAPLALTKELLYLALILAAILLFACHYRKLTAILPLDALAFALSAWFLLSYNAPYVLSEFPRLAVFCLPFACYLIWRFLSTRHTIPLWSVFAICLAVALFSALSTNNVSDSAKYLIHLTHFRA